MLHTLVRRATIASVLTLPLLSFAAESTLAEKTDFRVHNNSNSTITELYVSESTRDSWDNDILGENGLDTGSSVQVVFSNDATHVCFYDILAVFADGDSIEDYRVNVCDNGGYSFYGE